MSRPETQSRLGKCVQLQNKILTEKQSTQKPYIFSLGVKPALKICIQQGQVIIYRNFTTRKGTFLFKENFKACFIRFYFYPFLPVNNTGKPGSV